MFDDDSYYSFKVCELLLAESNLKNWVINNPIISTYSFLCVFSMVIDSFVNENCLSPAMKSNALSYLNLVRFNDDKRLDDIEIVLNNDKIELINEMIRKINVQNGINYIDYYRQELYKRTGNDDYLSDHSDYFIINSEDDLLKSMQLDQMVLFCHSDAVDDNEFEKEYLFDLASDLKYFESINCILEEYPRQFLNSLFLKRYNLVVKSYMNEHKDSINNHYIEIFNEKVNNMTKILLKN